MEDDLFTKYEREIFESKTKIYGLTGEFALNGSIEFLILKEEGFAEYVIEIRVEQNTFNENFDYGGFTIELPIQTYGFKQLQAKTFEENETLDAHGSFYLFNSYETLNLHKITFGSLNNGKLKANIEYSLDYPNWNQGRGILEVSLNVGPVILSNQVIEPINENRIKALPIIENYIDIKELNLNAQLSNLNGFRFEYKMF